MKKNILYTTFLILIVINIVSCSKKENENDTNTKIKPAKFFNGYFSILIPTGFKLSLDNYDAYPMIGPYGSAGDIFKYGNTADDSIKIHFNFGTLYQGNGLPYLDSASVAYYYKNDSIINIDSMTINNFSTTKLITFFNYKSTTDKRLTLFAFSSNPKAKLQLYSSYPLNPQQLEQVRSMMKTVRYYMP